MLRPGLSFARSRSPRHGRKKPKKRKDQGIPTHRLVRWENADKWRNTNAPRNDGAERTNLSAGSAYLPRDTSESSGGESTWTDPPREQRSRARNHGQLPEGRHGFRAVCLGDQATSGLEEWCRDRRNMPGIPGPLVHPGLRARSRESADGCHPDYVHPLQPSRRSRHAKDSESSERVDETDAAKESMVLAVDNGGCSFGDSVASHRAQLRGLPSHPGELTTLRERDLVAPNRPGTNGATGLFSLVIRQEGSGILSKTHTFDDSGDPRQTRTCYVTDRGMP